MDYTPSQWTVEHLKEVSEGAVDVSVLSACTRPWQIVRAVQKAKQPGSPRPSPLEWLRLAVAEAAATGQHVLVKHDVG